MNQNEQSQDYSIFEEGLIPLIALFKGFRRRDRDNYHKQ